MQGNKLNKSASKYYHTACLMDEALILLLEKKEYAFITVKEICQKAGVNRSTFYLHYETIDDLLAETIQYVGKKIHEKFNHKVLDKCTIKSAHLQELLLVTPDYLVPYLEFLKENKAIYKIAYAQPNILKEKSIVNHLYQKVFEPILDRFSVPKIEQRYMLSFYLSGMSAVMIDWIKNDCREDIAVILNILTKCLKLGDKSCLAGIIS